MSSNLKSTELDNLLVKDLIIELKFRNLNSKGKKNELYDRLKKYIQEEV